MVKKFGVFSWVEQKIYIVSASDRDEASGKLAERGHAGILFEVVDADAISPERRMPSVPPGLSGEGSAASCFALAASMCKEAREQAIGSKKGDAAPGPRRPAKEDVR